MPENPGGAAARRRAERDELAAYHLEADRRRRADESARAGVLVARFVERAVAAGLEPTGLAARPWTGRGRYRTGLRGWYLKRDRSIGVDRAGRFYVLVVAPQRWGWLRGVIVPPAEPPLQVGAGARDGESIALAALLELRLAAGSESD
jgi:hypothetical protein